MSGYASAKDSRLVVAILIHLQIASFWDLPCWDSNQRLELDISNLKYWATVEPQD